MRIDKNFVHIIISSIFYSPYLHYKNINKENLKYQNLKIY